MNTSNPFPPGALVVAYLRDSGGNEQDLSIEQQESVLRAWCAEHRLLLTHLYRDLRRPGSTAVNRVQFQAMIHTLQEGAPEAGIIVWKYSRFARDIDDAQFYKALLRRKGFIVHSLQDSIPDGINGRLFEAAIDWMNSRFLEDLSIDVKRGLTHLVEQYGALPGTPPVGFMRVPVIIGTRRDGSTHLAHRWDPDPALQDRVRLAWQMRAEGSSYAAIHRVTRLLGTASSYTSLFTNHLYKGELHYSDLIIPNYCAPIVDENTWQTVQALTNHTRRRFISPDPLTNPRRKASSGLLSGLAYCARCGAPLKIHTVPRKTANNEYYVCTGKQRRHDCTLPGTRRDQLEQAVLDLVRERILSDTALQDRQTQYEISAGAADPQLTAETQAARADLENIRLQIANLTAALAQAGASRALTNRLVDLEQQEIAMTNHLETLEQTHKNRAITPPIGEVRAAAAAMRDLLTNLNTDPEDLRLLYRGLINRITIDRHDRTLWTRIDFYHPPPIALTYAITRHHSGGTQKPPPKSRWGF